MELYEKLQDLRKYVLNLNLNEEEPFREIGEYTFYSSHGYVSIDKGDETLFNLFSTGSVNSLDVSMGNFDVYSRDDALARVNEYWDTVENTWEAEIEAVRKTLKPIEWELQ